MKERIKEFFRKKKTVTEGRVAEVITREEREFPLYSLNRESSNLSMIPFALQPVKRTYCNIETLGRNEVFEGDYHVHEGDRVLVTKTTLCGFTTRKLEKKY